MAEASAAAAGTADAAWVEVDLPWPAEAARDFIADPERLFRLNPHVEVEGWQREPGDATGAQSIRMRLHNELSGLRHELVPTLHVEAGGMSLRLDYDHGLRRSTTIRVQAMPAGSRLTLRDDYQAVTDPADPRLVEVDRSITAWGYAIRRHALAAERWKALPGYRRFVDRFWLTMPPRNRRISRLIIWTTAIEFAVFLFVFAIYWIEKLRPPA